ncbi:uncharacterized protein N7498_010760 [Penicillium cinerascens]|uniref:Uncharacterized protein n=1 Tax=Penicillium cinerascens TaxID=70096 RepID=A0A9W9JBB4_9EURO|nr:uncharacterized protein N7498_010760 [Penicillium cinerascens]KAJ5191775.1 hypothetical protein N7498_010760 [Penicillium cinerascens]
MVGSLIPLYERIDAILVRYGSFNSTQKFRLLVGDYYLKCDGHPNYLFPNGYINEIIRQNIMLRQITQEEENISERYGALKLETTTEENKKQLSEWLQRLEDLSREYWFHERDLYQLESRFPVGPLRRAYDSWRSNSKWYLHPDLVNECAGRGDAAAGSVDAVRSAMKLQEEDAGPVIVPQSVDAVPKPAGSS